MSEGTLYKIIDADKTERLIRAIEVETEDINCEECGTTVCTGESAEIDGEPAEVYCKECVEKFKCVAEKLKELKEAIDELD
jgi:predicted transcriptional regulator